MIKLKTPTLAASVHNFHGLTLLIGSEASLSSFSVAYGRLQAENAALHSLLIKHVEWASCQIKVWLCLQWLLFPKN